VTGPITTRDWLSEELAAGRGRVFHELPAGSVAEWWTTGWLLELADATAESAWDAWDALQDMRAER
jgi:hypothetical protein